MGDPAAEDYYKVLGVSRDATEQDISKAYKKAAIRWHPDKNQGDSKAEENFKRVAEAYDCLSNADKRAAYDRFGKAGVNGNGMGAGGASFNSEQAEAIFKVRARAPTRARMGGAAARARARLTSTATARARRGRSRSSAAPTPWRCSSTAGWAVPALAAWAACPGLRATLGRWTGRAVARARA